MAPAPSMIRRFVECAAFAAVAACVGSGMRTRGAPPATRAALTEFPVASAAPIETARVEPPCDSVISWEAWLCAVDPAPAPAPAVAATPPARASAAGPDAALRCDLVSRIAALAGWSRDDRRRVAVAAWFDDWSAARARLRDDAAPVSAATHRRFASEQDLLRERLGREFASDDAAAIARIVPLFSWDEASGLLRRVGADGKPYAPEGDAEVVTTVASR